MQAGDSCLAWDTMGEKPTWKAKLLMPATKRVSLPEQAWPETALGATALLCPELAMLGWAYAFSALHVPSAF